MEFLGYRREDGQVGIRNKILIISVDECCDGIARKIGDASENTVILTNWYTCMLGGNEETFNQMVAVGKSPNVAGVLVLAMGCGSIPPESIVNPIEATGKKVKYLVCQKEGGTRKTIEKGKEIVKEMDNYIKNLVPEKFPLSKLIVGVKCGGSDTSSGIASNPSVGKMVDTLVEMGGTCIGGELFELIGCEKILTKRAVNDKVKEKILTLIDNEKKRWSVEGTDLETMSIGNSVGGLTTIEEKSLGALHKMGHKPIEDVLQINKDFIDRPTKPGFYLSEVTMLCGGAGVNYAALGAHIIVWTSGAAGFNNPIVPVIRVSGNSELINDDIDVNVSGIMSGEIGVDEGGKLIVEKIAKVANGEKTNLEDIGSSTLTLYQKDQRVENLVGLKCVR
ncbi:MULTISPECIES: UxaA family hydrolase [Fusobacterium]|uniref:UxaA family hydrolase n=1 Tax=Fusobacterium TaxID=848 RepID=UPI001981348D|nr:MULTISPECIES: UxaA family hydrolase [Fusobacterium]